MARKHGIKSAVHDNGGKSGRPAGRAEGKSKMSKSFSGESNQIALGRKRLIFSKSSQMTFLEKIRCIAFRERESMSVGSLLLRQVKRKPLSHTRDFRGLSDDCGMGWPVAGSLGDGEKQTQ